MAHSSARSGSTPSPARYGFSDAERARSQLIAAGWWSESGPVPAFAEVVAALSRAADPDLALLAVDRFRESVGEWDAVSAELASDPGLRGRLLAVWGVSSAFADHLVAHPEDWQRLRSSRARGPSSVEGYTAALLSAVGAEGGTGEPGTSDGPVAALHGTEATSALRAEYRGLVLEIAGADLGAVVESSLDAPSYERVAAALSDVAVAALRAALAVAVR